MITQCFPCLPVPVRTGTVAPAIPDAQYKPGKSREQHSDQMQLSCFRKYPAHDIKYREYCMEDEEEDIEKGVPHKIGRTGAK